MTKDYLNFMQVPLVSQGRVDMLRQLYYNTKDTEDLKNYLTAKGLRDKQLDYIEMLEINDSITRFPSSKPTKENNPKHQHHNEGDRKSTEIFNINTYRQ